MPYAFTYNWSAPVENNYNESFHNSTRKTLTTHGYTFYMDEYDLDESVYGQETHRLDLRVVNPFDKESVLISHFNSYEELEEALGYIIQFIINTGKN